MPNEQSRQIIILFDGTGNSFTGGTEDTNVVKLHNLLSEAQDANQIVYYVGGPGSRTRVKFGGIYGVIHEKLNTQYRLASGIEAIDNIQGAYQFLSKTWTRRDEVYIFGFSRGAFAALALTEIINIYGLVDAWDAYRAKLFISDYLNFETKQSAALRNHIASERKRPINVKFLGVWDTVASIGIPFFLTLKVSPHKSVSDLGKAHVRHALALDEYRALFEPIVFKEENYSVSEGDSSLHQRWFRGCHADVGGGYPPDQSALSNDAFDWMLSEAKMVGLRAKLCKHSPARWILHNQVRPASLWALGGLSVRKHPAFATDTGNLVASNQEYDGQLKVVRYKPTIKEWIKPYFVLVPSWLLGVHIALSLQFSIPDEGMRPIRTIRDAVYEKILTPGIIIDAIREIAGFGFYEKYLYIALFALLWGMWIVSALATRIFLFQIDSKSKSSRAWPVMNIKYLAGWTIFFNITQALIPLFILNFLGAPRIILELTTCLWGLLEVASTLLIAATIIMVVYCIFSSIYFTTRSLIRSFWQRKW